MLFWLAVSPLPNRLMAQSTPSQCKVVERAPMPRSISPNRLRSRKGGVLFIPSCRRFLSPIKFSKLAGKKRFPTTPSRSAKHPSAPNLARNSGTRRDLLARSPPTPNSRAQSQTRLGKFFNHASLFNRSDKGVPIETKSGLTHGLSLIRRSFETRNSLIGLKARVSLSDELMVIQGQCTSMPRWRMARTPPRLFALCLDDCRRATAFLSNSSATTPARITAPMIAYSIWVGIQSTAQSCCARPA